ncbi:unnamed protein product [Larinioides sclopetarius]|uniref:ADAMTS-like protein 1 n=1 Tax=Larinioides sclopetarius TaxID=280406 RepID=A0AAV2B017_9ARAC
MTAISLVLGCIAVIILWLPNIRAKDVFPFIEESLLRLEGKSREKNSVTNSDDKQGNESRDQRNNDGWTSWSPWKPCSRSCDGGISLSFRKCRGRCPDGEPIRRQICNMQPCPESHDFRATQCTAYNNRPYRDRKYEWLPFYDPEDPCALICQAKGFNFVAKLAQKVMDGTRCREGALDMCVEGQCQPIGCDLHVGSTLKVDECGICGGDGSQCQRPTFIWHEGSYGTCSVTCGGGIQLSESTCRNKETNEEVDPRLCNLSIRPRTKAKHCNRHPCPVVWATGKWGPCSVTCGVGVQSRPVFCVQGGPNGSRIDVKSEFCPRHKPLTERSCSVEECPRWFQGPWSPCSVTCGEGIQTRAVVCRDTKNQYSELCDTNEMPRPQKICEMPDPCPQPPRGDDATTSPPCIFTPSTEEEPSTPTTEEPTTATEPVIYLTQAPHNLTSPIYYFVGPWSRCNGQGFRRRIVHCQTYLEIAQTVARLPDSECMEMRPTEVEPCVSSCPPPHPPREKEIINEKIVEKEVDTSFYSWNTEKFTPCTASCAGGVHTSIVRCLRLPDEAEVSPQLCDQGLKPESLTKKCNEQPCPIIYKWNITDFSNCSKECGGGIKTRTVKCVLVSEDVEVNTDHCPGPLQKAVDTCNVFDCEPSWKTETWSKCSRSCGGGFQTRKLHCEKILAPLSQAIQLPPSKCLKTRPKAIKKCNLKPCPAPPRTTTTTTTTTTTQKPTIDDETEISTLQPGEHVFVQKHPNRRVTLKASGQAILFKGSNAKFHCPVSPASNTSKVLWFKGHLRIPPSTTNGWPRVSVSGKGALRIHKIIFADAGTYTCLAGAFRSDVIVQVKPLPTRQPDAGFYSDTSSTTFISTTPSPIIENYHRILTNRSALPQVRHFLVNMRHFAEERIKSDPVVLEYEWIFGEWSKCSHSCGEKGVQLRTIECRVTVLNNATRHVPKGLCIDGGLTEPPTVRSCRLDPCPKWVTGNWSECSTKNCLSWNTAYQKRSVLCEMANRTITPSHCDSRKRPTRKRECFNSNCKGMWKEGHWSECTATCGNKGFRSRRVQCVWHGIEEPAPPSACKGSAPQSTKPCGRAPCKDEDEEDCYDQSTYCDVVKGTKLCEASQFRLQCCASCGIQE